MSLETGTYINSLVSTNPLSTDARSDGDDHIRLLKATLLATFPNITGAVTPTHTELNYVDGVTSNIQTQLNGKASMPAGTVCLFYQAAAPTGWTQVTTHNNKALRVVSGTGGGSGGSSGFTTAFGTPTLSGSVASHVLTTAEIPSHSHTVPFTSWSSNVGGSAGSPTGMYTGASSASTNAAGGGGGHTHGFSGTANISVQYVDVILASRD